MPETFARTLHTPWNCRWSRLAYSSTLQPAEAKPDIPWVCILRPGPARPVTGDDCAGCDEWERDERRES